MPGNLCFVFVQIELFANCAYMSLLIAVLPRSFGPAGIHVCEKYCCGVKLYNVICLNQYRKGFFSLESKIYLDIVSVFASSALTYCIMKHNAPLGSVFRPITLGGLAPVH